MIVRDLRNNVDTALSLSPAARVNGTANGTAIDLRGYDSAFVHVAFGVWTDGTHTPSLEHSDDGTAFSAVGTANQDGTFSAVSGTAGAHTVQRVGYIGDKRFVRAVITVTGATTGALSEVSVVRGHPARRPL